MHAISHLFPVLNVNGDRHSLLMVFACRRRLWKEEFVNKLALRPGARLLDVAGGTGDIAFRAIEYLNSTAPPRVNFGRDFDPAATKREPSSVVVCDINPSMLQVGVQRAEQRGFAMVPATDPLLLHAQQAAPSVNAGSSSSPIQKPFQPMESINNEAARPSGARLAFAHGDAMNLPFPDASFDAYTIAFGLRNVTGSRE